MAALYDSGKEGLLDRSIDMSSDVRVMLVRSTYVFSAAHKFVADLGAVDNGRSAALGGKTYTGGVFDATDTSLTALAAAQSGSLVVFQHTGSDATARLVAHIDSGSGLPFTPAVGQSVTVAWDNGANRIFKL